jgi:hypothetical protein
MNPTPFRYPVFLLFAFSLVHAQQPLEPPLRNWTAPLYWLPQPAEIEHQRAVPKDESALPHAAGFFSAPGPMTFVALTPCRVMDTRGNGFTGAFGPPSLAALGTPRQVPIPSSSCSVPSNAGAYSLNITAVPQGPTGFLIAYPTGQPLPLAATLVWAQGSITSNAAIVPSGTSGSVDVYANSATDLVIDINGYYAAPSDLFLNTAVGAGALANNTTGRGNTASGAFALNGNTTGGVNTASGAGALVGNTTGSNNIALGVSAAGNVSGGNSNNIHIGSAGSIGDNGTIRIGGNTNLGDPATQTQFFVSGVRGITTANNDAVPVVIDSAGQLGTVSSSRRFKEDIEDMGDASRGLMRLRPVSFRYQKPFADDSKPIQYGLIAEEVAEVYPDLVAHSADGQIETVKYQVLDAMLLNEVQRQQKQISTQAEQIRELQEQLRELKRGRHRSRR